MAINKKEKEKFSAVAAGKSDKISQGKPVTGIKPGDTATIETTITLPSVITKNTYRIAVEEVDIQDTKITDNYFEYTIGKSARK